MVDTSGNEVLPRFETVSLPDESSTTKKKTREKGKQSGEFANAKATGNKVVKYERKDI